MKKRLFVVLSICAALAICLAACGGSSASNSESSGGSSGSAAKSSKATPTYGSTIEFDDLSITFGDAVSTTTVDNQFSDLNGKTILALPVTITNNKDETHGLNMFGLKEFGAAGTQLDNCYTYFDDDVRMMGDMRPGASMEGYLYFPYDEDGTYYLEFSMMVGPKVEVELPVAL